MAKREMKSKNVEVTKVEHVEDDVAGQTAVPKEQKKEGGVTRGVVVGCEKLNIRKAPKTDAAVVTVVDAGTELRIADIEKAINGWYKVENGWCMSKYVKVK